MEAIRTDGKISCRTLWISDVHLGSVHSKAESLLQLLKRVECERLYLVGDIVDVWAMHKRVYWPEAHNRVLRQILKMSKRQVDVIYIPGNHDQNFREFCGSEFGNITIHKQVEHKTLAGKRMLVMHGDEFDYAVRYSRLNRWIGDIGYDLLMWFNRYINRAREALGKPYWSLAKWVKVNISQAGDAILAYQRAAAHFARDNRFDGIICGHLHYPVISEIDGVTYCNDGDWVENCTALVEDWEGALHLVKGLPVMEDSSELVLAKAQ
ncbi:UDP-2,3-diacylglucosamine diphosphatase [Halioglobus pacificus]|uniref:UDP-2,3-diacylglucosamine hydrolase n=1 Tax=Parahalioglobus pacificus TaxID=930806 RepID=A0A918XGB7_9GAMM|nr:UDP-2,3-diacylglucosamine diphosphatase [Halioglobus pacificus]GHD31022.1 UDP-2,3-diacylglucosamine hydrolase [Halioglobus pacificus]